MAFIKDAETKIYKDKYTKDGTDKVASKKESVRYTVDDLVRESDEQDGKRGSEEKDVSN